MAFVVGPRLAPAAPCFVYDFPASQAALARVRPANSAGEPPVAERFELFWKGPGAGERLTSSATPPSSARFEADRERRRVVGREVPPYDANLIEALAADSRTAPAWRPAWTGC